MKRKHLAPSPSHKAQQPMALRSLSSKDLPELGRDERLSQPRESSGGSSPRSILSNPERSVKQANRSAASRITGGLISETVPSSRRSSLSCERTLTAWENRAPRLFGR